MRKVICLPLVFALAGCFSAGDAIDLIAACSDLTFDEVQLQNGITDDCREAIESLLPDAENNFSSKLIPLGSEIDGSTNEPVPTASFSMLPLIQRFGARSRAISSRSRAPSKSSSTTPIRLPTRSGSRWEDSRRSFLSKSGPLLPSDHQEEGGGLREGLLSQCGASGRWPRRHRSLR